MNQVSHPSQAHAGQGKAGQHAGKTPDVKHDPVQNTGTVKGEASSLESTGILPEGAAAQMQQASSAPDKTTTENPPASEEAPAVEVIVKAAAPAPHAAMHDLNVSVLVTLDLTDSRMHELKAPLSRVEIDGQEVNLYNPFRKAGKKDDPKPAAEGIVRSMLSGLLDVTEQINNSRIMILGRESEIHANLRNAIDATRNQIIGLIPGTPDTTVATLTMADGETEEEITLSVSDIVKVSSWINSPKSSDEGTEVIAAHNAVININVTSGLIYDSTERAKQIAQIENILRLIQTKREDQSTNLLLAVLIDPATLAEQPMRELLDSLLDEMGFSLYTRHELHKCDAADWLPQSKAAVDRDLLTPTGDMLLVRLLGEDEEEEGEGGEAGGAE